MEVSGHVGASESDREIRCSCAHSTVAASLAVVAAVPTVMEDEVLTVFEVEHGKCFHMQLRSE